jgi:hypothetical protein
MKLSPCTWLTHQSHTHTYKSQTIESKHNAKTVRAKKKLTTRQWG